VRRVDEGIKQRGLIWHTQGSGKTLTMITIASLEDYEKLAEQ